MASGYWSRTSSTPLSPNTTPAQLERTTSQLDRAASQVSRASPQLDRLSSRRTPSQHTQSTGRSTYLDENLLDDVTNHFSPATSLNTNDSSDVRTAPTTTGYSASNFTTTPNFTTTTSSSHRLVIAVDYGTTFTGVAYATPRNNAAQLKDIEVVDNWGPQMGNHQKIDSKISYSRAHAGEAQWGASISLKAVVMVNTKMELETQAKKLHELESTLNVLEGTGYLAFENVRQAAGHAEYTWKKPEEIITDYLTKVFEHLYEAVKQFTSELIQQVPVDIVITVPVSWSYGAQNATFKAIKAAGFNQKQFPNIGDYIVVAEPEAAALFTARYLKEDKKEQFLKQRECFVLCDAGGGTVDLVSYQVTQLEPLELKKVGYATSDKCGAAFINATFKQWLKRFIGEQNYRYLDPQSASQRIGSHTTEGGDLRKLIENFEAIKKTFSNRSGVMKIDLPGALSQLNIPGRVSEGELTINPDEMRDIFNPCVNRVVELINQQIQQIEGEQRRVKNVFLVGGFGESPYLQEELRLSMESLKNIKIRRPEMNKSWTAVVQGAVIYGIEKSRHSKLKKMLSCPRSYAIVIDEPYSIRKFNSRDRYTDPTTNTAMARKQIAWMVRKGDLILTDEKKVVEKTFTYTFASNVNPVFDLPIYVYPDDDDDVPERWETGQHEIDEIGRIRCDISRYPKDEFDQRRNHQNGQTYYSVQMVCKMQLSTTLLEVDVQVNDNVIGQVRLPTNNTSNTPLHRNPTLGIGRRRSPSFDSERSY